MYGVVVTSLIELVYGVVVTSLIELVYGVVVGYNYVP